LKAFDESYSWAGSKPKQPDHESDSKTFQKVILHLFGQKHPPGPRFLWGL
jgi:hypothetical protein